MRFLENGPEIPDDLLYARDEGRVVLFCGAGVSRAKAKMPDFFGLAKAVLQHLGARTNGKAATLFRQAQEKAYNGLIPADRIFSLLEREFTIEDIYAAVATCLKPAPTVDRSTHEVLLRLATTNEGRTQLVTTNFDRLFESESRSTRIYLPPRFSPDDEFNGIVYLHGRVNESYSAADLGGMIITGADFGYGYLSEGWAAQYVRDILRTYDVLFVGYSADDPPMQYMLEGLTRWDGPRKKLYAFQAGESEETSARWRQKGVEPIVFQLQDHSANPYSALWESLEQWAVRADEPMEWRKAVAKQACSGPRAMLPHERGQVAHLVSTIDGAKCFADALPPAEWMCVFDPMCRYERPGNVDPYIFDSPKVDPFQLYRLDFDKVLDPSESIEQERSDIKTSAWDAFKLNEGDSKDSAPEHRATFRGNYSRHFPSLPKRLDWLSYWFASVSYQQAAFWWAARQATLHRDVPKKIEWAINRSREKYDKDSIRIWQLIFESWNNSQVEHDHADYDLESDIKQDGWSPGIVRRFIEYLKPSIKIRPRILAAPVPPSETHNNEVRALVRIDVECTGVPHGIEVPAEWLCNVMPGLTNNLILTVSLCNETGIADSEIIPPIEKDNSPGISDFQRARDISGQVLYYASLFERVAKTNPKLAEAIIVSWPSEDFIFARLRVWAMGKLGLALADDFAQAILNLSENVFWSSYDQRDLLIAMASRWNDLTPEKRLLIENRLRVGRIEWSDASEEKLRRWRAYDVLNRLEWLRSQGCQFSFEYDKEVKKFLIDAPEWKPEFAAGAVRSMEGRSGLVSVNEQYDSLLRLPINKILSEAQKGSGRSESNQFLERNPFSGLCKDRPVRAFMALTHAARHSDYPKWAWRSFLCCSKRKEDSLKFAVKIASLICSLPDEQVIILQYETTDWFENAAKSLSKDATAFDSCFEKLANALAGCTPPKSKTQRQRRIGIDTYNEASSSAIGKLVESVFQDSRLESDGVYIIDGCLNKLEKLLSHSGSWRLHALTMTASRLCWLYDKNPDWTEKWLFSVLDSGQRSEIDSFWSGFFMNPCFVNPVMFLRMKNGLLNQCGQITTDTSSSISQEMAGILLVYWSKASNASGTPLIEDSEFRDSLLDGGDELRSQVLWKLNRYCIKEDSTFREKWRLLAQRLFLKVWPRQRVAKNSVMTSRLCELLVADNQMFVNLIDVLKPLLTKLDGKPHPHHFLHDKKSVFSEYPEQLLEVLEKVLPDEVGSWPYGVEEALKWISDAKPALVKSDSFIRLNRKWMNR